MSRRKKPHHPGRPHPRSPRAASLSALREFADFNPLYRVEEWTIVEGAEDPSTIDWEGFTERIGTDNVDVLRALVAVSQWYPDGAPVAALVLDNMILNDAVVAKHPDGYIHLPITEDVVAGDNLLGLPADTTLPADQIREALHRKHASGMLMVAEEPMPDSPPVPILRILVGWNGRPGTAQRTPVFQDQLTGAQHAEFIQRLAAVIASRH